MLVDPENTDSNVIIPLKLSKDRFDRLLAFSMEIGLSLPECAKSLFEDLIGDEEFEVCAVETINLKGE